MNALQIVVPPPNIISLRKFETILRSQKAMLKSTNDEQRDVVVEPPLLIKRTAHFALQHRNASMEPDYTSEKLTYTRHIVESQSTGGTRWITERRHRRCKLEARRVDRHRVCTVRTRPSGLRMARRCATVSSRRCWSGISTGTSAPLLYFRQTQRRKQFRSPIS